MITELFASLLSSLQSRVLLGATAISVGLSLQYAVATPINYGDFVGSTVTYKQVTEDSGTDPVPPCMYCTPTVGGNTLNFNPVGFDAASSNGTAADITDGQIFFMVESNNKQTQSIQNIKISETGDTTLAGNVLVGSITTSSSVNIAAVVEIVEIDGIGVDPIKLTNIAAPPLPALTPTFVQIPANSPSDGTWHLGVDGNGGPTFFTQWNGELFVDIQDALIKSGRSFTRGATKVNVNIDNVLAATSEQGTSATIAKKDFFTITTNVPEPTTFGLVMLAAIGGLLTRRGR